MSVFGTERRSDRSSAISTWATNSLQVLSRFAPSQQLCVKSIAHCGLLQIATQAQPATCCSPPSSACYLLLPTKLSLLPVAPTNPIPPSLGRSEFLGQHA